MHCKRVRSGLFKVARASAVLALLLILTTCATLVEEMREAASDVQPQSIGVVLPTVTPKAATIATPANPQPTIAPTPSGPIEVRPVPIALAGPVAQRNAEVSGLAWFGDTLVLLPQYTNFHDADVHEFYTLSRAEILAYLNGEVEGPLTPTPLPVVVNGVPNLIAGYEGFEALVFDGARAWLTSEATAQGVTGAWLLRGEMVDNGAALLLDATNMTWIAPQSRFRNYSDEALLVTPQGLLTLYEVNGAEVNPNPQAHLFGWDLQALDAYPFPPVEYRITDATALDGEGRFWAINYFFPGDEWLLPEVDPIAATYGAGATHTQNVQVERLLEFHFDGAQVVRTQTPPIQLHLTLFSRNWEGIVRLDDAGFLLATDQFPETILAFVPFP